MKIVVMLVALFVLQGVNVFAFAPDGAKNPNDCAACHKLTKAEAQQIISKMDSSVVVEDISYAPMKGFYQISASGNKAKDIAYLDFSLRYLFHGTLFDTKDKSDLTQKALFAAMEAKRIDVKVIPLENALVLGNVKAKNSIYVFSDPDDPYCAKMYNELMNLIKDAPDLKLYIILYGLEMHPNANSKANAIIAASKSDMNKALQMLDNSYKGQPLDKYSGDKNYAVDHKKMANDLGIKAIPSIVYSDGRLMIGYKTAVEIKSGLTLK